MVDNKIDGLFEKSLSYGNKKLLDLSKRNRLLNYRMRKTGTFEIEGDSEELFSMLVDGNGFTFSTIILLSDDENTQKDVRKRTRKLEYIKKAN